MNAEKIFSDDDLVRCADCNTPTDGRYKIGENYYCHNDYELRKEKSINNKKQRELNQFQKFVNIIYD